LSDRAGLAGKRPLIAAGLYSYKIGGSERVGAQLAIEYATRGYQVVCFAFHGTQGPFRDYLESRGVECVDLNYLSRNRVLRRLTYRPELYRFLRARQVDAIHVHHALGLTLGGAAMHRARVKRVVMTEHAIFQLEEQPAYRRDAAKCCRYATAITGVHSGITDYFRDHLNVPADRLHVVTNGVPGFVGNAAARGRVRRALDISDSCFTFLYVGRLEAVKDLPTLLKAVNRLGDSSRRNIRVFLAGDGAERGALEQLSRSLEVQDTVTFLGARSDVDDLLNAVDAFVMTSSTEGLPMALIEAMAAGLPCIATAVGGIPQVLSDHAGLLVPPNDPAAVANAMLQLSSETALRQCIAENALRRIRSQYGLEPVVTKYLELLGLPDRWPDKV
jgi:glycosyltransferase involved in cell wall biosynthesis